MPPPINQRLRLQPPAQRYAPDVSAKVQQAIEAAPWRTEGNAHVPSVWSAVQTPVQVPSAGAVGQPLDEQQQAQQAVSAS